MSNTPKTIYLKDYQPPVFLTPETELQFDLFEDESFVTSEMTFRRNPKSQEKSQELFLDGENLELVEIKRDGETLDSSEYEVTEKGLNLLNCPDQFKLQTRVRLQPHLNKAFSGLYKTKTVFCTQMEAQGFRRTTYFQDRPDVLSKYRVTMTANKDKYPILLSNGNFVEIKDIEAGRQQAIWEDPFPKPCYLFALVAGDLDWIEDSFLTRTNRKVALRIFVDKGKKKRARFAMDSLKQAMKWDEETFRLEYDLDIYNIVAVDDFNMGAMENKGLNIFNSKYVLASSDTATDKEYQGIQSVIGHEYFHNWTGNRVTCRDWFQLSLKEGLTVFRDQEFSSDLNSRAVKRIEDVAQLRARQFPEDAGPMAHPVRPTSYIAIDNFYTVTIYEKGAEVIRMLHSLLGPDMFKKGVTRYFELYDGQAVTTDDWVHAMEDVSGRDLSQFKLWYSQVGTPQVSVSTTYDQEKQSLTINLKQQALDPLTKEENQAYHIPLQVGLVSEKGNSLEFYVGDTDKSVNNTVLELREKSQSFVLKNIYEKPVVSINREFSAPVQINFEQPEKELYLLMNSDPDSFNRWESAQQLYKKTLLQFYSNALSGESNSIPESLTNAMERLISRGSENPALAATLLQLPSIHYLAQFISDIQPQKLRQAYADFYREASKVLTARALEVYQALEDKNLGQSAKDVALRTFKNTLAVYIHRKDPSLAAPIFTKQFESARNMTDSLAALQRLSLDGGSEFEKACDTFRDKWKDDGLTLNKLYSVIANSKSDESFALVKKEIERPNFDITNPNNVYSLIHGFAYNNWAAFHKEDGSVYDWFADITLDVDSRNPQVASRLGSCLNTWKKFAPEYRSGLQKSLEKIRQGKPSDNLYEIVSRALDQK